MQTLCLNPSLPLVATHAAALEPQSTITTSLEPYHDPTPQRHASNTPCRLASSMPAMGTPAEPARHLPPPALSLHRRPQTKPRDQFPKPAQPGTDRARCPGRADSTRR
jgi:hypothetical protein